MIKLPEYDEQGVAYPWKDEPDFAYYTDKNTGLDYCINRSVELGFLCGYVIITKEEIELLVSIIDDFDVHGGVSFCDELTFKYINSSFAIGFDCGHARDLAPFQFAEEYNFIYSKQSLKHKLKNDIYRDIKYVQNECKKLVAQVADLLKLRK
jgi:hypothetical protein